MVIDYIQLLTIIFFSVSIEEYSDHPNEVVKNEELTYNGASSSRVQDRYSQLFVVLMGSLLISAILPQLLRWSDNITDENVYLIRRNPFFCDYPTFN